MGRKSLSKEQFKEITQKIQSEAWKTNSLREEPNVIQSGEWKTNSLLKTSENQVILPDVILPQGWASGKNEEGHVYYYHEETEEVSWHPPPITTTTTKETTKET